MEIKKVLIETSARHIHISKDDLETLFGEGYELKVKKYLSQPGEFISEDKLTIVGPKKEISGVSILGPCRKLTQIEISATDCRTLGIEIVVRESGNISNTPGCKLIGPNGELVLNQGVIVAKRHIHATTKDANEHCLYNNQIVGVEVINDSRSIIYNDVVVRVSDNYTFAMHVDTDESNAGLLGVNSYGRIIKY